MLASPTSPDQGGASTPPSGEVNRQTAASRAAAQLQKMEELAIHLRDLVLAQPPIKLLSYLVGMFYLQALRGREPVTGVYRPDKCAVDDFQFVLEYAHAVWSCHATLADESCALDEIKADEFLEISKTLHQETILYCFLSAGSNISPDRPRYLSDIEYLAKLSWTTIRGNRYQVLEKEFFDFVLAPHTEALRAAYGISATEVASGIQGIADAMRTGFSEASERMMLRMEDAYSIAGQTGEDIPGIVERLRSEDPIFQDEVSNDIKDMLFGGTHNLSRHSALPISLLEDLSYIPGENTEFYAPGEFCGTPMRTLPGRLKPGIKLGGEFYATDGQFVRDSAYRAIQRGIWSRLPYRDEWLKRQANLGEQAFQTIFFRQLENAKIFQSVYYRDFKTGAWVESDVVITFEDVLIVIEAKAGNLPMHSPATSFATHTRVINDLVVTAYSQCRRFLEYAASMKDAALFSLADGRYVEVATIRFNRFRTILPIGLTIESFTPFSAMAKELPAIESILGKYAFISMSVDDLFVVNRFLPTVGALAHYWEVRQQIAGIKSAMLFDEIDHLGAYIQNNRFDQTLRDYLMKADRVSTGSFSDVVDKYFEGPNWEANALPSQEIHAALAHVLDALDRCRPPGWLRMDSFLRNFDGAGRTAIGENISQLEETLKMHARRRFQVGGSPSLQVWLCRRGMLPTAEEIRFQADVGCLIAGDAEMAVVVLQYAGQAKIAQITCAFYPAPTVIQTNYSELHKEAERQRDRSRPLNTPGVRKNNRKRKGKR